MFTHGGGKPLDDKQLRCLLREHGIPAVPHGFRSSFRDWAAEETDAPHAVMEAALSHVIRNQVEAAYARSDLFERRCVLMEQWAEFLGAGRKPAGAPNRTTGAERGLEHGPCQRSDSRRETLSGTDRGGPLQQGVSGG